MTASQRAYGWAKYLNQFGYHPIILTRNWDHPIKTSADLVKSTGKRLKTQREKEYTVHYVPYKANTRDAILRNPKASKFLKVFGKGLTFYELIVQNFSIKVLPYSNLLVQAERILQKEKVEAIVVTGNPFVLFQFGDVLSRTYDVPWIADYRDDWTTGEMTERSSPLDKFLLTLERKSELKWLKSASCFTTISSYYRDKIQGLIQRQGHVLLNGFFQEKLEQYHPIEQLDQFEIVYNGTLYETQPIEIFLDGFRQFLEALPKAKRQRVQLTFLGLAFVPKQAERVKEKLVGFEANFRITGRVDHGRALEYQQKAAVLLMVAHQGVKGVPSSKIFEYFGLRKAVLLVNSDQDILHNLVQGYNLGRIANHKDEVLTYLESSFAQYFEEGNLEAADEDYVRQFNRSHQTKVLAELIDKIVS